MEAAQKDLSVLQCSFEDEETLTVALGIFKPERTLFVHSRYSVSQTLFKRTMFVAERPGVWGPRSASSAGIMSPVEIPFR